MKKIVLFIFVCLLSGDVSSQVRKGIEGSPLRAIQDLEAMLDSYRIGAMTPEDKRYNEDLKKRVLSGTFDIAELCRLALAQHWNDLQEKDRDSFVNLMTRLLEKKAIFSKEQSHSKSAGKSKADYYATYKGEKFLNPEKNKAIILSRVHVPSENLEISLDYKLKKNGGIWKIFDVIVEGASMLDNYKYQFDKIIKKDGYPDLVRRMESKLKEIEQK